MAGWNRPNAANQPAVKKGGTKSPSLMKGVIVGAVAVVVGVVCIFAFSGKSEKPAGKIDEGRGRIKEVKPAKAPTNKVEKAEDTTPKPLPPQRVGETRDGKILLPNGRLHVVKGVITNNSGLAKMPYQIFDHMSDNVIAGLLSIKPGQMLVGTPRYNGRFTKDFIESLKTPIIPTQADSEYERELKRAVNEAKIELKAAYDRGEDIEEILLNERKELQKLAAYKQELKAMTIQGLKEAETAEEMDDYIAAANKMLEAKGIAPMDELSPIAKIKLRMKELKAPKENKQ